MKRYAKIVDENTKQCEVGLGTNVEFYKSLGMTEMDVEQAWDGSWYVAGYAPEKPAPTKEEQQLARQAAYTTEVDCLHAQKMRHEIIGDWTDEDEAAYREKVVRLSEEIAEKYPYPVGE